MSCNNNSKTEGISLHIFTRNKVFLPSMDLLHSAKHENKCNFSGGVGGGGNLLTLSLNADISITVIAMTLKFHDFS